MTAALEHRGPDAHGHFKEGVVQLGSRRLAILDLSPSGNMPMEYRGRYIIVHNGEVYNYLEIRKELQQLGHAFSSGSDTEVIVAAYAEWGIDCLQRFNGMFSFAIYDRKRRRIFAARDRFGIKPFYYTEIGGMFCFASEIKAFTKIPGWKANANKERLYDFLVNGLLDHTSETCFRGVFQLRGGELLEYDLGSRSLSVSQWYDLRTRVLGGEVLYEDAVSHVGTLFDESVALRLRSDVKVGTCLSGGIDSSAIVCVMNDILHRTHARDLQESVSAVYQDHPASEEHFIDAVLRHTGIINHRVHPDKDELLAAIDRIHWHQDEPFGSTSIFAQWEVFKTARKNGLIVMLDGQGSDEYLAGYHHFFGPFFSALLHSGRLSRLLSEIGSFRSLHHYGAVDILKQLANVIPQSSLREILQKRFSGISGSWIDERYSNTSARYRQRMQNLREMSILSLLQTSLPVLLHWEDRNSMAHSVESRLPFLDYRLVEYCLTLPDDHKIRNGVTKSVFRDAMRGTLPDVIRKRYDKKGFTTPQSDWLKDISPTMRRDVREFIVHSKGFLKPEAERIFERGLSDPKTSANLPWRLYSLSLWAKVFNVSFN